MQIGIGIGMLLLGSWVLNAPVPEPADENQPAQAAPAFARPRPPRSTNTGLRSPEVPRERRITTREDVERAQERQRQLKSAETGVLQPGMVRQLPIAPTESPQPGTLGLPAWPTAPTSGGPAGPEATPGEQARVPYPAYRGATLPPASQASYSALGQQRDLAGSAAFRSFAPAGGPEKVLSGNQVSSSGVSPYLQLFRNDTAGGTIDNYTTLVRPALQQQRLNQQFGADLFGLQRDSRIQQASLQRFQTNVRTLQGVSTPQFNVSGNAFPGYVSPGGYGNLGYGPPSSGFGQGYAP